MWEDHPDETREALAHHDAILRSSVKEHGGHMVKMTGDGAHAVFTRAEDALSAAASAQTALAAAVFEVPLRVRMGIHPGTAEERDGDYFGPALNRAARLMAIGHGGQILLSLATEELAREGLPEGASLLDLGEHRLRDLTHVERVFQLCTPGLPSGFPSAIPRRIPRKPAAPAHVVRGSRRGGR